MVWSVHRVPVRCVMFASLKAQDLLPWPLSTFRTSADQTELHYYKTFAAHVSSKQIQRIQKLESFRSMSDKSLKAYIRLTKINM